MITEGGRLPSSGAVHLLDGPSPIGHTVTSPSTWGLLQAVPFSSREAQDQPQKHLWDRRVGTCTSENKSPHGLYRRYPSTSAIPTDPF